MRPAKLPGLGPLVARLLALGAVLGLVWGGGSPASQPGTGRRSQSGLSLPSRRGRSPSGLPLGPLPALGAAAALVLVLALVMALSLAAPAAAQTSQTLVSNLGQTSSSVGIRLSDSDVAQEFTAGGKFALDSITVSFDQAPSGLTVKVGTGTEQAIAASNCAVATDNCVRLTNPTLTTGNLTFSAPSNTVLEAGSYWLVLEGSGGRIERVQSQGAEDPGKAANWEITTGHQARTPNTGTGAFIVGSGLHSLGIRVSGRTLSKPEAPDRPTVSARSSTELLVRWWEPYDGNLAITDYDVRYREKLTTPPAWTELDDMTASTAKWARLTGLKAGTTYEVQVRAQNAEDEGDWSATASGTTLAGATSAGALVSNLGQTVGGPGALDVAQQFTAGTSFVLDSVTVRFSATPTSSLNVKVGSGQPHNLTNPVSLSNPALSSGDLKFTAPADTELDAGTYWVVVDLDAASLGETGTAITSTDDPGAAAGWSIDDRQHIRGKNASGPFARHSLDVHLKFRVDGKESKPKLRTAIPDQSVRAYTKLSFQVPDHTFVHDTGATLAYAATLADGTALAGPDDDTNTHWLKFDADTRTFSGTPGGDDVGTLAVTVTARDAAVTDGSTASDTFDLVVLERLAYGAAPALTGVKLVGNTGQTLQGPSCDSKSNDCGQGFTTGGQDGDPGYRLTGVTVRTASLGIDEGITDGTTTSADVYLADTNGRPTGTSKGAFTIPATTGAGLHTFTPTSGAIKLAANTRYVFVMDRSKATSQGNTGYRQTTSTLQDAGGEANWDIDGNAVSRGATAIGAFGTGTNPLHIEIHGYREPAETQTEGAVTRDAVPLKVTHPNTDATFPADPTNATAQPGPGQGEITVKWEWSKGSRADLGWWNVGCFRDDPNANTANDPLLDKTARSYTCTGLDVGAEYEVALRARRTDAGEASRLAASVRTLAHYTVSNEAPKISLVRVVSRPTADVTPRDGVHDTYMSEDRILVDVEFDRVVVVDTKGAAANVSVNLDLGTDDSTLTNSRRAVPLEAVLHGGRTLRFAYTVASADRDADGIWLQTKSATDDTVVALANGATIQAADTGHAAVLRYGGLPTAGGQLQGAERARVDGSDPTTTGPRPVSASIRGNELKVFFDKGIRINAAQNLVWNMAVQSTDVHGGERTAYQHPTNARPGALNGELVLTLGQAVGASDTVTLSHTYSSGNARALTDQSNRAAPAFTALAVTNNTGTKTPFPDRADVAGTSLRVVFDGLLDSGSAPPGSAFSVYATDNDLGSRTIPGTGTATIVGDTVASVSGNTVLVTLASAVRPDELADVSYARPSASRLRASGGGALVDSFSRFKLAKAHDTRHRRCRAGGWRTLGTMTPTAPTPRPGWP